MSSIYETWKMDRWQYGDYAHYFFSSTIGRILRANLLAKCWRLCQGFWLKNRAVWSGSMLFAISLSTCDRVGKRTVWVLIRLHRCAGWSGSMLVANPSCWFCHGTAHLNYRKCIYIWSQKQYLFVHFHFNFLIELLKNFHLDGIGHISCHILMHSKHKIVY
jgi:hypothetical protein